MSRSISTPPDYRLTSREGLFAARRLIPREDWQFGRVVDGRHVADPDFVTLKGGFKPGLTYELTYESQNPPVAGLGLAAVRDMASAMKYDPAIVAPGDTPTCTARHRRGARSGQIIYEGFTIDERGRKVFDAAFVKTGGASIGRFNERFALVNSLGVFTETQFPFQYQVTTDPVTGKRDGLGARIPAGLEPKIFTFDTGSEYWDKGRLGALRHASIDGTEDLPDAPNVRVYYVAGSRHGSGTVPAADGGGQFKNNTLNYDWAQRGLMAALDAWVREGKEPPPSRHPKFADGTMVPHHKLKFPAIPGVQWPTHVPGGYRWDVDTPCPRCRSSCPRWTPMATRSAVFVCRSRQVPLGDDDRLAVPERAHRRARTRSWSTAGRTSRSRRRAPSGRRAGDPRLSIEERYAEPRRLPGEGDAGRQSPRRGALRPAARRARHCRGCGQALGLADGRRTIQQRTLASACTIARCTIATFCR